MYGGRPGTIVPFSFRLLLAELPQYVHKPQEAFKRLFCVLSTVRKVCPLIFSLNLVFLLQLPIELQILKNLNDDLSEDGSHIELTANDRQESLKLWSSRETRVLHSIINLALQQKVRNLILLLDFKKIVISLILQDYRSAIDILHGIIEKPNPDQNIHHRRAITSALGRIYLQMGDMDVAKNWFEKSSSLKSSNQ